MLRLTALLCVALFAVMLMARPDSGTSQTSAPVLVKTSQKQPMPLQTNVETISYTSTSKPIVMPLTLPLVQPVATVAPVAAQDPSTVWYVKGNSVNVRQGPSTEYTVIGKLGHGEATTVLSTEANGWAHILIEGDGIEGYISTEFLVQDAP